MALPHMSSSFLTRRGQYEANITRRRQQEQRYNTELLDASDYFKKRGIETRAVEKWTSDASLSNSLSAFRKQADQSNRMAESEMRARRMKLAQLFAEERAHYEEELKYLHASRTASVMEMRCQAEALREERENERQADASRRLLDHWLQNDPELRKIKSETAANDAIDSWQDQLIEKQQNEQQERHKQEEEERLMEELRLEGLEQDREEAASRAAITKTFKSQLATQIEEVQAREDDAEQLRKEEAQLLTQRAQLQELEDRRRKEYAAAARKQHYRELRKQHATRLRQRSKQVQAELQQDRIYLEELAKVQAADDAVMRDKREKEETDARWMLQVVEEQLAEERRREDEMGRLYAEEAEKEWGKRERQWAREKQARERLMQQVLDERRDQLESKLDDVKAKQMDAIEDREQLIDDMKSVRIEQQMEEERQHREVELRKSELDAEVARRVATKQEVVEQEIEVERAQAEQQEEYDRVLQEHRDRARSTRRTQRAVPPINTDVLTSDRQGHMPTPTQLNPPYAHNGPVNEIPTKTPTSAQYYAAPAPLQQPFYGRRRIQAWT